MCTLAKLGPSVIFFILVNDLFFPEQNSQFVFIDEEGAGEISGKNTILNQCRLVLKI